MKQLTSFFHLVVLTGCLLHPGVGYHKHYGSSGYFSYPSYSYYPTYTYPYFYSTYQPYKHEPTNVEIRRAAQAGVW
jgi:hypothetical protein